MIINKNSWHYKIYRWTYWNNGFGVPNQTNLCQYVQRLFWMSLVNVFIILLLATLLLCISGGLVKFGWQHPLALLGIIATTIAVLFLIGLFIWTKEKIETTRITNAWLAAKKEKICPLVKFE
jgi:hypothetical protein